MLDFMIHTEQDLERAVESCGILPLFRNAVPGWSVEEHAAPETWFTDQEGVWEWKGPVIRGTGCAYGKFLGGKAVFISREWFPDFANWRRDGYDFDARFEDELASYQDKYLFELTDAMAPVLSKDLKKAGGYSKTGRKGFDTCMNRLQAQGYLLISDFVYARDRYGKEYGWGIAQYSTPERFMGAAFTDHVYERQPEASYARILAHVQSLAPDCDRQTIERYLQRGTESSRGAGSGTAQNWLVPSNPKYYDVVRAFEEEEVILWKQGNDRMQVGDIVYLYVGAPYSAILYRCEILETDIPYYGREEHVNIRKMIRIRRLRVYPKDRWTLQEMKKYDVVSVRCARSCPPKLADACEHS